VLGLRILRETLEKECWRDDAEAKGTTIAKTLERHTRRVAPAGHPTPCFDYSGSVPIVPRRIVPARLDIVASKGKGRAVCLFRQPGMARIHDDADLAASAGTCRCSDLVGTWQVDAMVAVSRSCVSLFRRLPRV